MKVLIVGTGAFAQGLASLAHRTGATAAYSISLGSRRLPSGSSAMLPGLEKTPVCSLEDKLADADLVITAFPASGLPGFVTSYGHQLAGKVVVDVTNIDRRDPPSNWPTTLKHAKSHSSQLDWTCDVDIKDVDQDKSCEDEYSDYKGRSWDTAYNKINSSASWLASVLPASTQVVKAFCNMSAYTLLHGDPLTEHMKSVAAADSPHGAAAVAELGRAMGIEMRVVHSLSYAATLEARQHSLLADWQWPFWLMFITWLVVHLYSFIRYNYYGGTPWQHVTMWILNKSVGWAALWGMVYTYLPGVLVCYMQLCQRQPSVRLPKWLKAWMDARKQLGLLSLAGTLLHLLFSTFLWMPSYYTKLWDNTDTAIVPLVNGSTVDKFGMMTDSKVPAGMQLLLSPHNLSYSFTNSTTLSTWPIAPPKGAGSGPLKSPAALNGSLPLEALTAVTNVITLRSRLNWIGESSTLLGIISGCLMGLIALTSLPSITPKMNWREWRLLQSHSGWLAVLTATVHVLLLGAPWWPKAKVDWPAMIPTITLLSTLPPIILLLMKGLIALPPLSMALSRVRSGAWAKKSDGPQILANVPAFAVKND